MSKSLLKAAREALDRQEFQEAIDSCNRVLELEPASYHAHVFAGLAQCKLGSYSDSEESFNKATLLQPEALLAYQVGSQCICGLRELTICTGLRYTLQNDEKYRKARSRLGKNQGHALESVSIVS